MKSEKQGHKRELLNRSQILIAIGVMLLANIIMICCAMLYSPAQQAGTYGETERLRNKLKDIAVATRQYHENNDSFLMVSKSSGNVAYQDWRYQLAPYLMVGDTHSQATTLSQHQHDDSMTLHSIDELYSVYFNNGHAYKAVAVIGDHTVWANKNLPSPASLYSCDVAYIVALPAQYSSSYSHSISIIDLYDILSIMRQTNGSSRTIEGIYALELTGRVVWISSETSSKELSEIFSYSCTDPAKMKR